MKKIVSLLLTLVLLTGLLSGLSISAAEELPPVYVKTEVNEEDGYLYVSLYTDGLRWTALDFGLKFDPAVVELEMISTGSKILTAQTKGYDFAIASRDVKKANETGYANFVCATGSTSVKMTSYAGAIANYQFSLPKTNVGKVEFGLCISSLLDANGKPMLSYTSFDLTQEPVVYLTETIDFFTFGDVDESGEIDISDALALMNYLVGNSDLTENQKKAAAVSGEEELSVYDAMLIMQYIVGNITEFPVTAEAEE